MLTSLFFFDGGEVFEGSLVEVKSILIPSPTRRTTVSRQKSFSPAKITDARKTEGLNQSAFWSRFGVTQSGGSRYESGRSIPNPTAMLIWLRQSGRISDKDLADAQKAVKAGAK